MFGLWSFVVRPRDFGGRRHFPSQRICAQSRRWRSFAALFGCAGSVAAEFEEVGGAGDAGVVVADGLFGAPGDLFVVEIEQARHVAPEVLFHAAEVLRRGRNDARGGDQAVLVH